MKRPQEFRVLLVYPNLTMMLVPSMAIAVFTGILRRAGYEVDLFDTTHYVAPTPISSEEVRAGWLQLRTFDPEKDLGVHLGTDIIGDFQRKVDDFKPDLIVMSTVEDTFLQGISMLDSISDANIPSIVGGVFVTAAPEKAISFPQVNMIGVGEGEHTVLDVAERIRKGDSCETAPNVWVKRPDGSTIKNGMGPLVKIDEPLPDFSLFDDARFYRPMGGRIFKTLPLETYRGCPYSCTFCNSPMQTKIMGENQLGTFVRRKTLGAVRREIQFLIEKHSPEYLFIIDDSFLARPDHEIQSFIEMYEEFKLPFWFNTRPENVTPERLSALKSVNCDRMSFGLECGNEEYRRKVITRNPTNEQIVRQFNIIADSGIAWSVNNMIGFPDETREMIFETVDLNRRLHGYDSIAVAIFTPYHGTPLRELAIKKGYMDPEAVTQHTASTSLLTQPQITAAELDGIARTFTCYVTFPKEDWPNIRKAEEDTPDGNKLFAEYQQLFTERHFSGTQDDKLQDWDAPQEYSVRPKSDPAKQQPQEKPWGFNCGAEQTEYVVPPAGIKG